jgi:hypothetical protein
MMHIFGSVVKLACLPSGMGTEFDL